MAAIRDRDENPQLLEGHERSIYKIDWYHKNYSLD
jgi:hypothetical protein